MEAMRAKSPTRATILVAGASGVVGARALAHLVEQTDVARVVAVGRRPLAEPHHAKVIACVADMSQAYAIEAAMSAALASSAVSGSGAESEASPPRVAICCLGTTRKQAGSREAFRAVDVGAVRAFGEAAKRLGVTRMVAVTSLGANKRSWSDYLRAKADAEEALAELAFEQLTIVRPSAIDDEGARRERRIGERLWLPVGRAVFSVLGKTMRYAPISANVIGAAIVTLAFDETRERVRIIESETLHELGKSSERGDADKARMP